MKQPIRFMFRNVVFGATLADAWAVYRLPLEPYDGLSPAAKHELLWRVAALAGALEADFTLLRVARAWSVADHEMGVAAASDVLRVHQDELRAHLARQRPVLQERGISVPEAYLWVRLPRAAPGEPARADPQPAAGRGAHSRGGPRGISAHRLEALMGAEAGVAGRVRDVLRGVPAAGFELQWLVRRSSWRGLGEPRLDERFVPQALVVAATAADGGHRYQPLETDVHRLFDCPVTAGARGLRVETEAGTSHQALLCLGALPETVAFPGPRAELMFAPIEALEFPVDVAFSARVVGHADAVRLVPRRIDDPGLPAGGARRGPLLCATVSLAVGADGPEELERRVERLRRAYDPVALHRPAGEQLALFVGQLPGRLLALPDYDDYLTLEQLGAMVPTASRTVGSAAGSYLGHTAGGARHPVLLDPVEASRTGRAPATLLAGPAGAGGALCLELLLYQAFLAGATVCDVDPSGAHALARLPGVAGHAEVLELGAAPRFRGLLDPLRSAPDELGEELAEELAHHFLLALLPEPVAPAWCAALRLALGAVRGRGARCTGAVLDELAAGGPAARDLAQALRARTASGLAALGVAAAGDPDPRPAASHQLTSVRVPGLALPRPGAPGRHRSEEERVGRALLPLLAVHALQRTSTTTSRRVVLAVDGAWSLLGDAAGRALVAAVARHARPHDDLALLLATSTLDDLDELDGLVSTVVCFGVETEREARRALRLLGLDAGDPAVRRLRGARRGRCVMRDAAGRVGAVQVDVADPELLAALDAAARARGPEPRGSGGLTLVPGTPSV